MKKKGKYNQRNEEEDVKKKNIIISEEHLMDKSHMEPTQYLSFLPQDSLYPPFTITEEEVIALRKILKDLNYILYLNFKNFWATLLYNPSFKICIHSCIRFLHRRWLNNYISKTEGDIQKQSQMINENYNKIKDTNQFEYTQALMKVVLLIFFRITHFAQQNQQLSNFYNLKSQIVTKYVLDFPRLLEIIQIYGQTNSEIVRVIIRQFVGLSPTLYSDFKDQLIQPMISRMSKNLNLVKKTTDRQQFGIQYNYKRNVSGQLSAGEQELKKKICLLMEILSFYQTLKNIYQFFPNIWGEPTKFNMEIHNLSENMFIELEQAYRIWNNHEQGQIIYALMNIILKQIVQYFREFLQKCNSLFVQKKENSNFKEAYMKCFDRMIENYGRRQSLGKKAITTKRYMQLYKQILKTFKIDEFTSKLYVEEAENETYGINMQFLTDFKIAIDEQIAKMQGRPLSMPDQFQQKTQADIDSQKQEQIIQQYNQGQIRKKSQKLQVQRKTSTKEDLQNLDKLEMMISKRNREDNYYQRLYKDYKTKIVVEYEDEYDDLKDYEKRPMFEDNDKQQQQSSVGSSGEQFDQQMEKLHLVKSQSNVSRTRGQGTQHHPHQKYDRKNKAKFVPVKDAQAKKIIAKQANKNKNAQKQKPNYISKQDTKKNKEKQFDESRGYFKKQNQYDDEECYQQCKPNIKGQQLNTKQENTKRYDDQDSDEDNKRDTRGRGRGKRGGNQNNRDREKGTNTNKKPKYVSKD